MKSVTNSCSLASLTWDYGLNPPRTPHAKVALDRQDVTLSDAYIPGGRASFCGTDLESVTNTCSLASLTRHYRLSLGKLSLQQAVKMFVHGSQVANAQLLRMWLDVLDNEDDEDYQQPSEKQFSPNREVRERGDAWLSGWGVMLRTWHLSDPKHRDAAVFKRRFRVPYPVFEDLVCFRRSRL